DAGRFDDVLAQVVDADVGELHGIEGGAPQLRGGCRVSRLAEEAELDVVDRQAAAGPGGIGRARVPGEAGVEIVERPGARHEDLARADLFGRAAVVAHRAL